jgi:hypothetical protein
MNNEIWRLEPGWLAAYTEDRDLMRRIRRYKAAKWPVMATYSRPHSRAKDRHVVFARQYLIPARDYRSAMRMFKVTQISAENAEFSEIEAEKDVSYAEPPKKPQNGKSAQNCVKYTQFFTRTGDQYAIPEDRAIVEAHCANYAGEGRCVYDRPCPYFAEKPTQRCRYYEDNVLPNDQAAEIAYWQARGWPRGTGDRLTSCKSCGKPFMRPVKTATYCAECSARIAEEKGEVYRE